MTSQESIEERLARIEERLRSIDAHLERQIACRHVTRDGECDFFASVVENDRRINQWSGALGAVAFICSLIGGMLGVMLTKFWR